ncbi:hypothetical protein MKW94_030677 [Papaver nudicaule]|uniref:RING-type domain-containing protein n=1 Tax=Papaver nudicaule TaxID=74823 RepID=A0AA41V4V4_PAPNU|nr:hypothetical protein [Papaver nudicaule]
MANQKNRAIIVTVLIVLICIIIISLIRFIIKRYSTTTTTTSPPPHQINHHSPQQIHHRSLRVHFNNNNNHIMTNQSLINSLPKFKFDSITGIPRSSSTESLDCAICIGKFRKRDELRLLPNCSHVFHSKCIDKWILVSNQQNCPLCRSSIKLIENQDGGNEISESSRSFRVEIGSFSRRIDGSISASDLQNRSYSLGGSFEYWIQDFDAEVYADISISVGDDCGGGMDEDGGGRATEVVVENRPEPDEEFASCRSYLSCNLQYSDRFYGGSERWTGGEGGGEKEGGGGGVGGRVWDLEGNKFVGESSFGAQFSDFFGFLSRV